jgi:hypothetical protein
MHHPDAKRAAGMQTLDLRAKRSPHERSDMRVTPGYRFAHPGYNANGEIPRELVLSTFV